MPGLCRTYLHGLDLHAALINTYFARCITVSTCWTINWRLVTNLPVVSQLLVIGGLHIKVITNECEVGLQSSIPYIWALLSNKKQKCKCMMVS